MAARSEEAENWDHLFEIVDGVSVPVPAYRVPGKKPSFIVTDPAKRTLAPERDAEEPISNKFDLFHPFNILEPQTLAALRAGCYIAPSMELLRFLTKEEHHEMRMILYDPGVVWVVPTGVVSKKVIEWWCSTWLLLRQRILACRESLQFNDKIRMANQRTRDIAMRKQLDSIAMKKAAERLRTATQRRVPVQTKKRKASDDSDEESDAMKHKIALNSDVDAKASSQTVISSVPPPSKKHKYHADVTEDTEPSVLGDLSLFDHTYGGSYDSEPTSPLPLDLSKCPERCLKFNTTECPCTGKYRKAVDTVETSPPEPQRLSKRTVIVDLSILTEPTYLRYSLTNRRMALIRWPIEYAKGPSESYVCENDVRKDQPRRPVYGVLENQISSSDAVDTDDDKRYDAAKPRVYMANEAVHSLSLALQDLVEYKDRAAKKMLVDYYQRLAKGSKAWAWPRDIESAKDILPLWREYRCKKTDPRQDGLHPLRECIYSCDSGGIGWDTSAGTAEVEVDSRYRVKMSYTSVCSDHVEE
ncbi:hypothetical protein CYLTODRAFT_407514 [Cylindrobasidium torrendii FP15055 ss-10]|uniref:Uncharacterized protein n=1 Tax=Cylindrobasidium torrendii FP15055 ss-10 TaxID=1314674 RepID=A0A0D7BRN0_9AGAR|nr:hypothetical protein CYLTODRAFT_407514 [Cylindrobasidium torrendii FP15055 ss-10]